MPTLRPNSGRPGPAPAALAILAIALAPAAARGSAPYRLTVLDRAVTQDCVPQENVPRTPLRSWQAWQVDYRLRLDGPTALVVTPAEVTATVSGWVSNSRVPSHAAPLRSTLTVSGASGFSATTSVVESSDEVHRCRERAVLQVWDGPEDPDVAPPPAADPKEADAADKAERRPILSVAPGGTFRVRLRLVHQHHLYGVYDPLLGRRSLDLTLGSATLRDDLPLDREHHVVLPAIAWPAPPDERRDPRQFVSAPDSLHLEAHVAGNQYYRFPEQPVRYSTRMRLRYWYLVAPGTEGDCKVRISQYKEFATNWKVLPDGAYEDSLTTVGRWVRVEKVFRTEPEATSLALDFKIVITGADVGELWIDDVSLEPVDAAPEGP